MRKQHMNKLSYIFILLWNFHVYPSAAKTQVDRYGSVSPILMPEEIQQILTGKSKLSESERLERIKTFIAKDKQNIDAATKYGETVAMLAVSTANKNPHMESQIFYLSNPKPNLHAVDYRGWNVLHYASHYAVLSLINGLTRKKIPNDLDINERTAFGSTALDLANNAAKNCTTCNGYHAGYSVNELKYCGALTDEQLKQTKNKDEKK